MTFLNAIESVIGNQDFVFVIIIISIVNPTFETNDSILLQAVRLGKHALKDKQDNDIVIQKI